jgi:beta-phosphoglucomutase-like phosphatase (HAD superfamily)
MSARPYDAIVFDLDGVICFTDVYHYRGWKSVADELGIPFDETVNNRLRGVSRMESLDIILEPYEGEALSDERKLELATITNDRYRVMLGALSPQDLHPRFGADSAREHTRDAVRLDLDLPALRTDVDDDTSLRQAMAIGVGRHTAAVLHLAPTARD